MAHLDGFEADSYLKSGANELRVLEYNVCGMSFGINILKVKKIVSHMNQFMAMPEAHPAVRGVFEERGSVIPLIDLAFFLGIPRDKDNPPEKVIITEFFEMQNGLWVDRIDWIHHFRWEDVIDAEGVMHGFDQKYVIGIVKPTEEKMVLLLDYENIILDICPQLRSTANNQFEKSSISGQGRRLLVAEDSPAIRSMLVTEFSEVGFEVEAARDGKEAWEKFAESEDNPYDLVISDVEMPRMDGLALTVAIRGSKHRNTPVIVYSSIGDVGMKARANFLKANAHITKLNFDALLAEVDRLCEQPEAIQSIPASIEEEIPEETHDILTEENQPEEETAEVPEEEIIPEIEDEVIDDEPVAVLEKVTELAAKDEKEDDSSDPAVSGPGKKPKASPSKKKTATKKTTEKKPTAKKKSSSQKKAKTKKGNIKKTTPVV